MSRNRRIDDDEFEARARKNLARIENPDPAVVEISIGGDSLEPDLILAELDAIGIDTEVEALSERELYELEKIEREEGRETRGKLVRDAAIRYGKDGPFYAANAARVAENSAAEGRQRYAEKIEAEQGRPVRRYRRGLDAPTPEQRKAEKAEYDRDRYERNAASKPRKNRSLKDTTPEERQERLREQWAASKRRKRAGQD